MGGQGGQGGDPEGGMDAQVTFFVTAMMSTLSIAAVLFRYRSSSTYYDDGDVLGTNYWKLANVYGSYFWLGAFGIATVTQLLAFFGIANSVNLAVWIYGLEVVGGIVGLATSLAMLLGYDTAYTIANDDSESASDIAKAETVQAAIKDDMMMGTLDALVTELTLAAVAEEWFEWNNYKMQPDRQGGR